MNAGNGVEILIGDATYKTRHYLEPDDGDLPPGGQGPDRLARVG